MKKKIATSLQTITPIKFNNFSFKVSFFNMYSLVFENCIKGDIYQPSAAVNGVGHVLFFFLF
jgi:hypothetical protein